MRVGFSKAAADFFLPARMVYEGSDFSTSPSTLAAVHLL